MEWSGTSPCVEEEFVVFMHDLADSAEVTRRVESIGEYGIHDLSMLEDGSVGMVVRVEKDAAMLMMQSSTPERPDVRATRLHDMRRKAGPAAVYSAVYSVVHSHAYFARLTHERKSLTEVHT